MNQFRVAGSWCLALIVFLSSGCASVLVTKKMDDKYGSPNPARYEAPSQAAHPGWPEYWKDVRPIMARRCVVCHGCYDAPCQQNLTSWEGITRGATPEKV